MGCTAAKMEHAGTDNINGGADIEEPRAEIQSLNEQIAELKKSHADQIAELEKENRRLTVLTKQQQRINDELRAKYEEVCAKLAKYEETAPLQVEEPDPWAQVD